MDEFYNKWFYNATIGKLIAFLIGIIIIWLLVKFFQKRGVRVIKNNDHKYKAKKISAFVGYFLSVILILIIYSSQLSGFTVALGVAGAGIAFALQEVIASVAGWMAVLFGGFFKTGDRIQLGGITGDVIDIGVLRTTLMETGQWVDADLYNGRIVRVANSFVFKEPVFNYSADFPFLWDEIKIPIQYGSDYLRIKDMFQKIAIEVAGDLTVQSKEKWDDLVNKYLLENAQTEPMVTLAANDNWVEFTIRYVVNYRKRRWTKNELYIKILTEAEKADFKINFASATFQIVGVPELNVKMKN